METKTTKLADLSVSLINHMFEFVQHTEDLIAFLTLNRACNIKYKQTTYHSFYKVLQSIENDNIKKSLEECLYFHKEERGKIYIMVPKIKSLPLIKEDMEADPNSYEHILSELVSKNIHISDEILLTHRSFINIYTGKRLCNYLLVPINKWYYNRWLKHSDGSMIRIRDYSVKRAAIINKILSTDNELVNHFTRYDKEKAIIYAIKFVMARSFGNSDIVDK